MSVHQEDLCHTSRTLAHSGQSSDRFDLRNELAIDEDKFRENPKPFFSHVYVMYVCWFENFNKTSCVALGCESVRSFPRLKKKSFRGCLSVLGVFLGRVNFERVIN